MDVSRVYYFGDGTIGLSYNYSINKVVVEVADEEVGLKFVEEFLPLSSELVKALGEREALEIVYNRLVFENHKRF